MYVNLPSATPTVASMFVKNASSIQVAMPMVPFGVGAPLILVYFSGDWDVHWGYGFDCPFPMR